MKTHKGADDKSIVTLWCRGAIFTGCFPIVSKGSKMVVRTVSNGWSRVIQ